MAYATWEDVQAGFRALSADEQSLATELLDRAGIIIDAVANSNTGEDVKRLVSCNMVTRAMSAAGVPVGATGGTVSALGYSQTWQLSGSSGELYLSKLDRRLLGCSNAIGSYSPVEELTGDSDA